MAKVKTPNQMSKYRGLNRRLAGYVLLVEQIYDELNLEAAKLALTTGYDGSKPFRFKDFPNTSDRVQKLKKKFVEELKAVIYSGTSKEWKESNLVQDLLADKVLKTFGVKHRGKKEKVYYQVNSDALKAFQERKINGMGLSANLWNQAANYREELEYAISSAVQKGTSAVTLSKRLSKYLKDFPKLQKEYKQKFGKAVECHDCEYRSIRLARSEINMSYRTAEQMRWQQMDFVVGYEIKLSAKHPCHDVCDSLAGKYPKDFKWTGWHPNDMCYVVPILNTEDEFWSDSTTSVNEVKDVPEGFKKWVEDNSNRLYNAEMKGTLPYFVKDNKSVVDVIRKDVLVRRIKDNYGIIPKEVRLEVNRSISNNAPIQTVISNAKTGADRLQKGLNLFRDDMIASSSKIKEMFSELESPEVMGGDPIYRYRLMSMIKDEAAEVTSMRLDKLGVVRGLNYEGLEKNTSFYYKEDKIVHHTGEIVSVEGLKRDVLKYRDDNNVIYYYPLGVNSSNISFSASEASNIIGGFEPKLIKEIKGIMFDIQDHPLDKYYQKAYEGFTNGAMYSGEIITVHKGNVNREIFERNLLHELGHSLDNGMSNLPMWKEAIRMDGVYISKYAENSLLEDFAETFAEAYMAIRKGHTLKGVVPYRFDILERLIERLRK